MRAFLASMTLLTAAATAPLSAQALQKHYNVNIPREALDAALKDFANQTGLQIARFAKQGEVDAQVGPVSGDLTAEDVLHTLLVPSGLTYQIINERTIAVVAAGKESDNGTRSQEPDAGKVRKPSLREQFRLAETGQVGPGQSSSVESESSEKLSAAPTEAGESKPLLEEIIVTGSHIRGEEAAGSKVITLTREEIDRSGYGTLEDVFFSLPQNFSAINEGVNVAVSNNNHGAAIDLHGLGPGTTLTLVNGHREPEGGLTGAFVDISSIPASAIERVEILTDGASAIYGSDAIGGVANIILRDNLQGIETSARYGARDGGANEIQASQLFGHTWSGGSFLLGYEYFNRGSLPCSARAYCASNGDYRQFGGTDQRTYYGNPGTILDAAGLPAFAIPHGQNGRSLQVSQLIPGANYTDYASGRTILPHELKNSVFFSVKQSLGSGMEIFADGQFADRATQTVGLSTLRTVSVPATNPFFVDPFGGSKSVLVDYDFTRDLGPTRNLGKTRTYALNSGVKIDLPASWELSAVGSYGRETNSNVNLNTTATFLIRPYLADPDPATALNVFGDGPSTNRATLDAIRNTSYENATSEVWSVNLVGTGPVLELPGGSVKLAVGSEFRHEKEPFSQFDIAGGAPIPSDGIAGSPARSISAVFSELAVPIVGAGNSVPGVERLEFSVSGRWDHYDDVGHTINPKVGVTWKPVQSLALRGTWGTSFRAPPFYLSSAAFGPNQYGVFQVPDPQSQSPSHLSNALVLFGNNQGLKPETATIWTTGLDFTPVRLPALKISATYFNIDYRDRIQAAGLLYNFLSNPRLFAPVITRNPSPSQLAPYCNSPYFGFGSCDVPIAAILNDETFNLSVVRESGIDFEIHDSLDTAAGRWNFYVSGTRLFHHDVALTPTSPANDTLSTVDNPLGLRLRGGASWGLGGWSVGANVNYSQRYEDSSTTSVTSIPSLTTVDLNAGYRFAESHGWLDNTRLTVTAVNIANRMPPFVNQFTGGNGGYDPVNGSLLGRLVSVQVVKGW